MVDQIKNVTVIIRSVDERTEKLCQELIVQQGIPRDNIIILREVPFSQALKKGFQLGIERGLPWTWCNDADILLRPNAIKTMLGFAEEQDERVCEIQGYILDKFFGGYRKGGINLYRTSLLPIVLDKIPQEGVDIRPEHRTLKGMKQAGYPFMTVPYAVGIHDFDQYYKDIVRKCFVHAHKHIHCAQLLLGVWREKAKEDVDYCVALQGFAKGIEHNGEVFIDIHQEVYQTAFRDLQITEKEELAPDAYTVDHIEDIIQNWKNPAAYTEAYPEDVIQKKSPQHHSDFMSFLKGKYSEIGLLRFFVFLLGSAFSFCGRLLKNISG
ncbi:MAG: hypothetical protein D3918_01280 [Candidatus Electrothrix sp. AX2]|nr:hypothetical protein [Candidatus Electrothrix gigas]